MDIVDLTCDDSTVHVISFIGPREEKPVVIDVPRALSFVPEARKLIMAKAACLMWKFDTVQYLCFKQVEGYWKMKDHLAVAARKMSNIAIAESCASAQMYASSDAQMFASLLSDLSPSQIEVLCEIFTYDVLAVAELFSNVVLDSDISSARRRFRTYQAHFSAKLHHFNALLLPHHPYRRDCDAIDEGFKLHSWLIVDTNMAHAFKNFLSGLLD